MKNSEVKLKEQVVNELTELFDSNQLDIPEQLEVIANYFIRLGVDLTDGDFFPSEITQDELLDLVIKYRKEYGETLGTALIHQGLVLLMWLQTID